MARATREEWTKRVARWRDSGLTAREYATEIGVNVHTQQQWGWRLNAEARKGKGATRSKPAASKKSGSRVPVVEVIGVGATSPSSGPAISYEVVLRDGTMIRVPPSFDDATLHRLVSVLEAR